MPARQPRLFSASYDSTTRIISAVISVLLAVIAIATQSAIAAGVGAAILFLSYGFSPRAYVISDRGIVVRRLIRDARISLVGIGEVRVAGADDFRGAIRLWGDGGLFGYYGLFRTSRLGKCWWYLTNRQNAIVVVSETMTALFSPDDVDGFLAALRAEAPLPETGPSEPLPDATQHPGGSAGR